MSLHNRLLLNRAAVSGLPRLQVLILMAGDRGRWAAATDRGEAMTQELGGRVEKRVPQIGYLRVDVPRERVLELVNAPEVGAYQIASLSRSAWYRDTPPLANAQMYRSYEVTPIASDAPAPPRPDLPLLTRADARAAGFTGDDSAHAAWMHEHPTYDGRGVTIALIENALPSFMDPAFQTARALDGGELPKIAGIVNAIDGRDPDETRVGLDVAVDTSTTWTTVDRRTYILPRPGRYRFGILEVPAGGNVTHKFAIVEDEATHEVRIDSNGDASFQDEAPLADVNDRFEPRLLTLSHPRKETIAFVMSRGMADVVHIYLGKGSHQTMTMSVAAGAADVGLASGVAPGARVLLVRVSSWTTSLANQLEGFIAAAERPDVDVIGSATALTSVPDTAADFAGALATRLVDVYRKPIVMSAANTSGILASAQSFGTALSVGGVLSPDTYAALYGGRALDRLIVHPISAAGPALDGAIKPDVLAPMERLSADLPWNAAIGVVPRNAPARSVPAGYQISCCTSATSPYAAGAVAVLISAAKQAGVSVDAKTISRALRFSAQRLSGVSADRQGNGVLDIQRAWQELLRGDDPPAIVATAPIVHPLAAYAARGGAGTGLFEYEGWSTGQAGTRELVFRRTSGTARPLICSLEWSAGDGTFSSAASIVLPLGTAVRLPVHVAVRTPGVHSALLTLKDRESDRPVFRTQATVVAAEHADRSGTLTLRGTVAALGHAAHYIQVPAGIAALTFDLQVVRGVVRPTIVPAHGLFPSYYMHVHPSNVHFAGSGRYQVTLPSPAAGTWAFRLDADSAIFSIPGNPVPADAGDAEYVLTVRQLAASLQASAAPDSTLRVTTVSLTGALDEPALDISRANLTTTRGTFLPTGLPNLVDIDVPKDAGTLRLQLRTEGNGTAELYLYDCTTGECFSYNIGFPAAAAHTVVVRKPNAGRWVAAVNAAPFPTAAGGFTLERIVTIGAPERHPYGKDARLKLDATNQVLLIELVDAAAERRRWSTRPNYELRDQPVAIGTAIYRR